MAAKTHNIQHVVHISTNIGRACEHCSECAGLDGFAQSINHDMEAHGYRLLHVGRETDRDHEGDVSHFTVAVVGS